MYKTFKILLLIVVATILCIISVIPAFAMVPYKTYTYTYGGEVSESPHAYLPKHSVNGNDLGVGRLKDPADILIDNQGRLYITDTGNDRILCFDKNMELRFELSDFENPDHEEGTDSLSGPSGIFVTDDGLIYIADTNNRRIVVMDDKGKFVRIVHEPVGDVLPNDFIYNPSALVVDGAGRLYIVARNTNMGIVSMTQEGEFQGFMGAQKVTPNLADVFWRFIATREQRIRVRQYVPTEYNNITIDQYGFLFVTTSTVDSWSQHAAIQNRDRGGEYAPIKRLNPAGDDVLKRIGFFPPAGDIKIEFGPNLREYGPSTIIDVALHQNGIYTILDSKRNKLFTYDERGNLLYAFGGLGQQFGIFERVSAIEYMGNNILVLDGSNGVITIFEPTDYGLAVFSAIEANKARQYDLAIELWEDVLIKNSNFDLAYVGMGNASLRNTEYREAMNYFKLANNWEGYSRAYKEIRKDFISQYILLIPLLALLIILLAGKFLKYARQYNLEGQKFGTSASIKRELLFSFHLIFHPFDGFYDLKFEKRGSKRASVFILILVVVSFVFRRLIMGYIFNPNQNVSFNLFSEILQIVIPFALWCLANWCLTSLMDGEGSAKDIFIMSSYSLIPIALFNFPVAIMSNFLIIEEVAFLTFFTNFSYGWSAFLLLVGTMITHNYTIPKNLVTTAFTVTGMGVIAFIIILFFGLLQRLFAFLSNLGMEIMFRL